MIKHISTFILAGLLLTASAARAESQSSTFEKDRAAILAMAGAFEVHFDFKETVALLPGYKLHEPHESGAAELVEIVEDSPRKIVLQHILVVANEEGEEHVVKHWRQEWVYENTMLYEFQGFNKWSPRMLTKEEAAGTWTQRVFQVDDSPRYEGFGKWVHDDNLVYWESNETWRPLPRREHTTRKDYDVLVARNRHTLTPTGWMHEQDNYKLVLDPKKESAGRVIVREVGLNSYTKVDPSEVAKAAEYWKESAPFWVDVRAYWDARFATGETLELRAEVDDQPLYVHISKYLKELRYTKKMDDPGRKARIDVIIDEFVLSNDYEKSNAHSSAAGR